jgi:hypothetical protein
MSDADQQPPRTLICQAAKLGDVACLLAEFDMVASHLRDGLPVGRIFGVSGGAFAALAAGLEWASRSQPERWEGAAHAVHDFGTFLEAAPSAALRSRNFNPWYGPYNLRPLRAWVAGRLRGYGAPEEAWLSDLGVGFYLCTIDRDGTFTLLGPPDDQLQFQYHAVRVGPPRDAPITDALVAALSTLLSTEPAWVRSRDGGGEWLRDARPAIVDAGAIVADLEGADHRPIVRTRPHAPIRAWPLNWITSSFIMHSSNERNQTLLAAHYLDLLERHRALQRRVAALRRPPVLGGTPSVGHVDLPYIGSTEAFTNMRQSAHDKDALMARFRALLDGQLDSFDFGREANVIYGAGGFSGILAGLVTTRAVDEGFASASGRVRQVYGVSAGVLNGFFHAIQLAAACRPDLYTAAARTALADLEAFVGAVEPKRIAAINLNPARFWLGWANLGPMRAFFLDRLRAYTGTSHPEDLTFDDLDLPLTVAAARGDGFTDFLGPSQPARRMTFGGRSWSPVNTPVVAALIAGWSMNTYIQPANLNGQQYRDGGGTFYDPALFVACMDESLVNLLNIHLDEPEGHSYDLPERPNLLRLLFDTHNYIFPEERRRMRLLTDLLFEHERLRRSFALASGESVPDFRQEWVPSPEAAGISLPEANPAARG